MANALRLEQAEPRPANARSIDLGVLAVRQLLTLPEVAILLNCSRRQVTNLTTLKRRGHAPRLRTVREGRSIRVTRVDLDAYVQRLRIEAGIRR